MGPRGRGHGRADRTAVPEDRDRGAGGIVDSHTHLGSCDTAVEQLVAEAVEAGVSRIVTIGCGQASSEQAVQFTEMFDEVYAAIGVHPVDADGFKRSDEGWIGELAQHPKVVAIGECGLDYYRERSRPESQHRAFITQIGLARELDLPIVVHTREADDDTLAILAREAEGHPVILHCFSMTKHLATVVERGYMTSFAGQLTYPSAPDLQRAAKELPPELLLVETDAPYLSPVPRRGKPNCPANVQYTLEFLADLRGEDPDTLDEITSANAGRVFGWAA